MVKACSATDCNSRDVEENKKKGILFHKFPANKMLQREWAIATRREGKIKGTVWTPSEFSFLCSKHFLPRDYKILGKRKLLQKYAIPSVFSFSKNVRNVNENSVILREKINIPRRKESDHTYCVPIDEVTFLEKKLECAKEKVINTENELRNARKKLKHQSEIIKSLLGDLEGKRLLIEDNKFIMQERNVKYPVLILKPVT